MNMDSYLDFIDTCIRYLVLGIGVLVPAIVLVIIIGVFIDLSIRKVLDFFKVTYMLIEWILLRKEFNEWRKKQHLIKGAMTAEEKKEFEAYKEAKSWFAKKTNRKVDKLDHYDLHICLVAYQYASHVNATELEINKKLRDDYNELLMAVACKFPDESRHETALRYIRERESTPVWDSADNQPSQPDSIEKKDE